MKIYELLKHIYETKVEFNRITIFDNSARCIVYDTEDFDTFESTHVDVIMDISRFLDNEVQDYTFDGVTLKIYIRQEIKMTETKTRKPRIRKTKNVNLDNLKSLAVKVNNDISFINDKLQECNDNEKLSYKSVIDDLIYLQETNLKILEMSDVK